MFDLAWRRVPAMRPLNCFVWMLTKRSNPALLGPINFHSSYFFKNALNKSIGSGRKVVVLCSLAISRMVWR